MMTEDIQGLQFTAYNQSTAIIITCNINIELTVIKFIRNLASIATTSITLVYTCIHSISK